MRFDCREGKKKRKKEEARGRGVRRGKKQDREMVVFMLMPFSITQIKGGDILGCLIVFCSHREMCFLFASLALVCCGFFVTFSCVVDGVLAAVAPGIRQQSSKKGFSHMRQ